MSGESTQFGRVPYEVIDTGTLAEVKPAAAKVYLILLAHADKTWHARVGVRRLAELAGIQTGSVSRSVGQLCEAGLIETEAAGNGHPLIYRIVTEPPGNRSPVRERSTVHRGANGSKGGRSPVGGGTVHPVAQNRSPVSERNRENREEQSAASEFSFPLRGRGEWTLPADRLGEYRRTFPGLDVGAELRRARLWLLDNPSRRKTATCMPRFLSGWLTRAKPDDAETTRNRDGSPTSADLDRICPLVEPSEDDFAAVAAELQRKDADR